MSKILITCALVASLAVRATPLHGQTAEQTPSAALTWRADSLTVGQYCRLASRILADTSVLQVLAADSSDARASAAIICNPLLSSFSLLGITGRAPAPWQAVARLNTNAYGEAQRGIFDAMTAFRADVRQPGVREVVRVSLGAASDEFVRVSETAHGLVATMARDRALTRLANYERKLGPTSARLNVPEVLLNYAAQRWVPGFRPTPLRGPSPWELVASYAPGYVTVASGSSKPVPVSASEFGVRYYLFGERFGRTGLAGLLRPSYGSIGVLTASDENGALVWPWRGHDRSGAYVSWGAVKVGYINRSRGSWLVSKQFQAIPFVF
jgi:hypothetical protein